MSSQFDKSQPPPGPGDDLLRFQYHFSLAEGSQVQRGCIAIAMVAITEEKVENESRDLSTEDQIIFMMTYECFTLWCIKRGLDDVLGHDEVEPIIAGIHRHFATHAFYRPHVFEKIWKKMQVVMPMAMDPGPDGIVYPAAELLMAPRLAGYTLSPTAGVDLLFGMFVGLVMGDLRRAARAQATPRVTR